MLTIKRIFLSATFLLTLTLLIGGCGEKGIVTQMAPGAVPDGAAL